MGMMPGKPYIVKWAEDTNHPTIDNPVFAGVTISGDASAVETSTVHFIGSYNPLVISEEGDKKLLYMGGDNTVYYPNGAMNINAFRAYSIYRATSYVVSRHQQATSTTLFFTSATGRPMLLKIV